MELDTYDIRRLALILAKQAELDGMKIKNREREIAGHSPAYSSKNFEEISFELAELAYAHNEQLFG